MGSVMVDQIASDGALVSDADTTLSERERNDLLLDALPGARTTTLAGVRVVRFSDQVIFKAQVTHLGIPWPAFKKRIQIPRSWRAAERQARSEGLVPRFVGIYHYGNVTVFVDFDPATYMRRKANNSAAHVATNDLFQAQTTGQFSRTDRNGNRLTSVRADEFERYLREGLTTPSPRLEVFAQFNEEFLDGRPTHSLDAVKQMHDEGWPDCFQAEWPGFYLEFRLSTFASNAGQLDRVAFQKVKHHGGYDYDLRFPDGRSTSFYGDLKASDIVKHDAPGNDAERIRKCVEEFGKFWYVIYEHETHKAKDHSDVATIAWNEWKQSVGYENAKGFDPLSYATRFKSSVRFVKMLILEINEANFHVALGDFAQGKQPDGAARALKVIIKKRNVDNFIIFSGTAPTEPVGAT